MKKIYLVIKIKAVVACISEWLLVWLKIYNSFNI